MHSGLVNFVRKNFLLQLSFLIFLVTGTNAGNIERVTGLEHRQNQFIIKTPQADIKICVLDNDVFRLWISPDGKFDYYNDYNSYIIKPGIDSFDGPDDLSYENKDNSITIKTNKFVIKFDKNPFRFYLYKSNELLLTCNPPNSNFQPEYLTHLLRDANGKTEHFFGIQVDKAETLDLRDLHLNTWDKNGNGWVSPFFMSTAGYGIFLHNEHGWSNRFDFKEIIEIENFEKKGRVDLFFFVDDDFKNMINKYTQLTGRCPMPPIKHLGFHYLVQGTPISDYEAFPQWRQRGYPIDGCITFTDRAVITKEDQEKVAKTAKQIHEMNGRFGFYYDLKPAPGTFKDVNPEDRNYPHDDWDYYRKILNSRLIENGVDWFWIDETDDYGRTDTCDERFPFHLYNVMSQELLNFTQKRPFLCGRGGFAGCQRFGYPWMGDLDYNRSTILANLNNGLIGVGFSTHDMAGAGLTDKDEQHYLNGVKANLLNPITQCNAWVPGQKPSHRPWEWSETAEKIFLKYLNLHYELIPYFYSTCRQTHLTGIPAWRSLILENPQDNDFHSSDQIMIGDYLMMAPLYENSSRNIILPPGKWYHYFTGKQYTGKTLLENFSSEIDQYPIFVKAGAIIPTMEPMQYLFEKPVEKMTIDIYPHNSSTFEIYWDDGKTMDYIKGDYHLTKITCDESDNKISINFSYSGPYKFPVKTFLLKIACQKPEKVLLADKDLNQFQTMDSLVKADSGWCFVNDELTDKKRLFVKFAKDKKGQNILINTK